MAKHVLNIEKRAKLGGSTGKLCRSAGKIPGIIYGGEENISIAIDKREFDHLLQDISENSVIELKEGKKTIKVLIKDYDYDILTDSLIHIDFLEFSQDAPIVLNIPVRLSGTPVGVREGGLQENRLSLLKIRCLAKNIPASVDLEIGDLIIGQAIHVKDLPAMKDVRILTPNEQTIVTVTHTRETKQAEMLAAKESAS